MTPIASTPAARRARAYRSLDGLSVGDAFGERWFFGSPADRLARRAPPGPWRWTDDTHMALSIVECLAEADGIDPDSLALRLARRYAEDDQRGYGPGAHRLLSAILAGRDWRAESRLLFRGEGSFGNGAAMRVAPLGAYFADAPGRVVDEARRSAMVTHAHAEGQAGAIAVAVAAARLSAGHADGPGDFLAAVGATVPEGETRARILDARSIDGADPVRAARALGCGEDISAQDTVPFCLWVVAHHGEDFERALWHCSDAAGDVDTTSAIVGGILGAGGRAIPPAWLERREPLPLGEARQS